MNTRRIVVFDNYLELRTPLLKTSEWSRVKTDFSFLTLATEREVHDFLESLSSDRDILPDEIDLIAVHYPFFERKKRALEECCRMKNISLILFSGTIRNPVYSNDNDLKQLSIPSNLFYSNNLMDFLNAYKADSEINLLILAYGKNYKRIVLEKGVDNFLAWMDDSLDGEYYDTVRDELLSVITPSLKQELEDGREGKYPKSYDKIMFQFRELTRLLLNEPNLPEDIRVPDFKTHHSVANSWCLYNWSKYIGIPGERIAVRERIESEPYFQQLLSGRGVSEVARSLPPIEGKGKIMLVDDEAEDGWHLFFETLLSENKGIELVSPGIAYNKIETAEQLLKELSVYIEANDPDVVILDLRLLQQDSIADTDFSSLKVLQMIKEFNKGIQVIVMTASNKVWNMKKFIEEGAYGYVVKESPLYDQEDGYAEIAIPRLTGLISEAFDRAGLLKPVATKTKESICLLGSLQKHYTDDSYLQFLNEVQQLFDISWMVLDSYPVNERSVALAFFNYFQIAEKYGKLELITKNNKCSLSVKQKDNTWKEINLDNSPLRYHKAETESNSFAHFTREDNKEGSKERDKEQYTGSTLGSVSYLLACRLGLGDNELHDWGAYISYRNSFAHGGNYSMITKQTIHNFLDFIIKVLRKEDEKS